MDETQVTQENQASAPDAAKPAAAPKVAAPKLTLKHDGKELSLLKYPFPVKAARFPVTINGAKVDAATTAGRGKAYTYLLINNTSFYVTGTLPVDAACEVNFPDGYKFDDKVAARISNYKPKKPKAAAAPVDPAPAASATSDTVADAATAEQSASEPAGEAPQPDAPKNAKRRGR